MFDNHLRLFEGNNLIIRHEWGGIYRFGLYSSLFRIYGFYEDVSRSSFIAIDAITKGKQKLNKAERKRIENVLEVKINHNWRRV